MTTKYFDREGLPMSRDAYLAKLKDASYQIVRQFDNGKVLIRIVWKGEVPDADKQFRSTYKVFALELSNYNDQGKPVPDPFSGRFFPDEKMATSFYEDFILKWTDSTMDEEGNIEEVGNTLAPPPPPPPPPSSDLPTSSVANLKGDVDDGGIGAW
jgi:hypothetical protein